MKAEAAQAINTVGAPVGKRPTSTEGTPTRTVSCLASASDKADRNEVAGGLRVDGNSAGGASCGGIWPRPICTPTSTPITWAMTAPGPRKRQQRE